jgi:hypothetical protein
LNRKRPRRHSSSSPIVNLPCLPSRARGRAVYSLQPYSLCFSSTSTREWSHCSLFASLKEPSFGRRTALFQEARVQRAHRQEALRVSVCVCRWSSVRWALPTPPPRSHRLRCPRGGEARACAPDDRELSHPSQCAREVLAYLKFSISDSSSHRAPKTHNT